METIQSHSEFSSDERLSLRKRKKLSLFGLPKQNFSETRSCVSIILTSITSVKIKLRILRKKYAVFSTVSHEIDSTASLLFIILSLLKMREN